MATISTPGVGSGLDVRTIVSQLVALERQPITQLQTKASSLQTKLSAYGRLKSEMATLQDAATALTNPSTWNSKTFTSNNTSAVTGSVTEGALATSFSVRVNNLAQAQSVRSGALATNAAIGSEGRLDLQSGKWDGTTFTSSGSAVSVNILDTDTLSDIAGKINSSGAGVTAVVVRSGAEDRLLLRGNGTGDDAGFRIQSFDGGGTAITDGTTGVGSLAFDHGPTGFYGMTRTQTAMDANIEIDGIAVSSATNTVSDAVPGVTLNLLAETTSNAQVSIAANEAETKARLETFQKAYNTLNASLADLTRYNAANKSAGPLQGDSTAVGLQSVLRSMLGANGPAGTSFSRLSDVGMELQRDGSLSINSAKLTASLAKPEDLRTFFDADSGNATTDGLAKRLGDFVRTAVSIDGTIDNRNKALKSAIDRNTTEQERISERVTRSETRLYAQFSRLDANMAALSSLGSFVSSQVAVWNQSS
jgi:flagellar hook-associated protein 2